MELAVTSFVSENTKEEQEQDKCSLCCHFNIPRSPDQARNIKYIGNIVALINLHLKALNYV